MVVRMVKLNDKENLNEVKEFKVMEGGIYKSGGSSKVFILYGVNNVIYRSSFDIINVKKLLVDGKVYRDRLFVLV